MINNRPPSEDKSYQLSQNFRLHPYKKHEAETKFTIIYTSSHKCAVYTIFIPLAIEEILWQTALKLGYPAFTVLIRQGHDSLGK